MTRDRPRGRSHLGVAVAVIEIDNEKQTTPARCARGCEEAAREDEARRRLGGRVAIRDDVGEAKPGLLEESPGARAGLGFGRGTRWAGVG